MYDALMVVGYISWATLIVGFSVLTRNTVINRRARKAKDAARDRLRRKKEQEAWDDEFFDKIQEFHDDLK